MKELRQDLWNVEADLRVITTNPVRRADGACVMGRGCALETARRCPGIEYRLGDLIGEHGNRVMRIGRYDGVDLASFPVKRHWKEEAVPGLIFRSANQLVELADKFGYRRIVVPRPGCGNGRLKWDDVEPVLSRIFDDRFTVVSK